MHTPQVTPDESFEDPDETLPEEEEDDGYCGACAGTGEGQYDGTSCSVCGGRGVRKSKPDSDDYDPPEDDFEPWDGPL